MSNFGNIPTSNPPVFGNNPAVTSESCYHMFMVSILWQNHGAQGGLANLRRALPQTSTRMIPKFSGSIVKFCFCATEDAIKELKSDLRKHFPASINLKPYELGQSGNAARVMGYELTTRDCDCGWPGPGDCIGFEEMDILGPGGRPVDINTGSWVTSTGDIRQFPGGGRKEILQDIVNTERGNSLPCCKKSSSSGRSSGSYTSRPN